MSSKYGTHADIAASEKRCVGCKRVKPATKFTIRCSGYVSKKTGLKSTKPYLSAHCTRCMCKLSIKWRNANRARYDEYHRAYQKRKAAQMKQKNTVSKSKQTV